MSAPTPVELLDRTFRPGGETVRQILERLEREDREVWPKDGPDPCDPSDPRWDDRY